MLFLLCLPSFLPSFLTGEIITTNEQQHNNNNTAATNSAKEDGNKEDKDRTLSASHTLTHSLSFSVLRERTNQRTNERTNERLPQSTINQFTRKSQVPIHNSQLFIHSFIHSFIHPVGRNGTVSGTVAQSANQPTQPNPAQPTTNPRFRVPTSVSTSFALSRGHEIAHKPSTTNMTDSDTNDMADTHVAVGSCWSIYQLACLCVHLLGVIWYALLPDCMLA